MAYKTCICIILLYIVKIHTLISEIHSEATLRNVPEDINKLITL